MLEVIIEEDEEDEFTNVMKVYHNGVLIIDKCDYYEPEDVSYNRDLSWIPDAIRHVYKLGVIDGENKNVKEKM